MIDYHIHTSRCCHACGSVEEYLQEAERKGIEEIGFADHFPLGLLDYSPRVQVTMNPSELEEYMDQVLSLKSRADRVRVRLGIEVDYIPGREKMLERLLKRYSFDYVIGSIHFMGDWDFTHPVYADTYRNRDIEDIYSKYFRMIGDLCRSGLFDIVGHIDVVKKFGYRPDGGFEERWFEIARLLKDAGTCLELNTAGRDAPVGEFYPDRRLLEISCAEGVPVTTGSDAHDPAQVGRYFIEAEELLRSAGYTELAAFSGRTRQAIPL